MKSFMEYDFDIHSIDISCYVAPGCGTPVHKNRIGHGLVFSITDEQAFNFDNGKVITTYENEILYLPKGSSYVTGQSKLYSCYAVNFQFFNDITFPPFAFKPRNSKNFATLFQTLNDIWTHKPPGYEIKAKSLLYGILYELKKEYEIRYISKSIANIIKPAIDYIHNEYTNDNISISYLSELCDISETYFRRIFFKSFGVSPIKYINTLKMERAKELISSGLYSIDEAAEEAGFHDGSYFSRKFKESTGMTPSEYRKNRFKENINENI